MVCWVPVTVLVLVLRISSPYPGANHVAQPFFFETKKEKERIVCRLAALSRTSRGTVSLLGP